MGVKLRPYSLQVGGGGGAAAVPLSIVTTSPLVAGTVAIAPYAVALVAAGGTQPYTWTLLAGALPGGVTLAANGLVAGTPTTSGVFTPTFRVTDALGATKDLAASITISGASLFTDQFTRADTTFGYGPDWIFSRYGTLPTAFVQIDEFRIVTNAACVGASGAAFTSASMMCMYPRSVIGTFPSTANQYAEVKYLSANFLAGSRQMLAGPGVLQNWGSTTATPNGYIAALLDTGLTLSLQRCTGATPYVNTLATTTVPLLAVNDIVRIDATINVADVTVRLWLNGVLLLTYVDVDVTRPLFGYPNIACDLITRTAAPGATSQMRFDYFDCGVI